MKTALIAVGVCLFSVLNVAAQPWTGANTSDPATRTGNVGIGSGAQNPAALLEITKPATIGLLRVGDGNSYMDWYGDGYNDINAYGSASGYIRQATAFSSGRARVTRPLRS
jgi:hypothetical protein